MIDGGFFRFVGARCRCAVRFGGGATGAEREGGRMVELDGFGCVGSGCCMWSSLLSDFSRLCVRKIMRITWIRVGLDQIEFAAEAVGRSVRKVDVFGAIGSRSCEELSYC